MFLAGVLSATFTFVNKCDYTIWPGILANAGSPRLDSTGFELPQDSSRSFVAPTGWSGRFWGRTRCNFDGSGSGSCLTGDCGSGQVECNGLGAAPPATLAEFTLGSGGQDFYDVSLVDGYNLPMIVESSGGSGLCSTTGCSTDGDACKSACEAFGSAEYCCSGAFNTPATCKPSVYSQVFKSACPKSYSYAYDDATSTFTCTGADYTVTFCPSSSPSYSTPVAGATSQQQGAGSGLEYSADGSGSGYPGSGAGTGTGTVTGSGSASGDAMLADGSYLAGLAMGDSTRTASISALQISLVAFAAFSSFVFSFGYL
ncbi:Pathogenesis-related thaumatin superfamily protein [Citrus sinensis]|nr:Pathogenesis-related thaumatin superfamily protein [Citrus sinensis]